MPQKSTPLFHKNLIIIGFVIALITITFLITRQRKLSTQVSVPSPTSSPKTEAVIQPAVNKPVYPSGWKEYKNEKYGYSIRYPASIIVRKYSYNMFVQEQGNTSSIVAKGIDSLGEIEVVKSTMNIAISALKEKNNAYSIPRSIVDEKRVDFHGYDATQLIFSSSGDLKLITTYFLIENKDRTYILSWGAFEYDSNLSYDNFGQRIFATFYLN